MPDGASNIQRALGAAKDKYDDLSATYVIQIIIFGLCSLIVIIVFGWSWSKLTLEARNCSNLNKLYKNPPPGFTSLTSDNPDNCHSLRDYYIKTAYNCCATGSYKNDFVSLCALEDCIKQGVRCLDFEIYSVDDKPVISVSAVNNVHVKGSYNSIPFADALKTISQRAFGGQSLCPNPHDPLIIYLRIMSNNRAIYTEMADNIYSTLEDKLLGKKHSYENNGSNLGQIPITSLMDKVVIIADKTNSLFADTPLDEYVNLATRGPFMRILRYNQLINTPNSGELTEFNKKNMSICLPDLGIAPKNPSATLAMTYGCQFVAMGFQNFDTNLEQYDDYFDSKGSAFALKPASLRFIPQFHKAPPPADKKLSYATRHVSTPYQTPFPI